MSGESRSAPAAIAVALAHDFLARVWGPAHDLSAIDELMTPDYRITSGGTVVEGRDAFRAWVAGFQKVLQDARTVPIETFASAAGDLVVSRWVCSGANNGVFGLPPDGRRVEFTGIAIWRVRDGRLSECWVERAALEAFLALAPRPSSA